NHARQMDAPAGERVRDGRESANEARRGEPPKDFVLAEPEAPGAKLEHRSTCELEMDPSLFDLRKVREHLGEDAIPIGDERLQGRQSLFVRLCGEVHDKV